MSGGSRQLIEHAQPSLSLSSQAQLSVAGAKSIQLRVPSLPVIPGAHSNLEEVASGETGSAVEARQDPDYSLKRCQIWTGQSQIKVQGMCFV